MRNENHDGPVTIITEELDILILWVSKVRRCFLTAVAPPHLPSAPVSQAPGKLSGCWSEPGDPRGSKSDEGTSC